MSEVKYTASWDYPVQGGEASATSPVYYLTLTTEVNGLQSINDTDTKANTIIEAIESAAPGERADSAASYLDGVKRNWNLGQVGEVGQ